MAFSYQFGSNPRIDYPRLLIADTDSAHPIFDDQEILAMYVIDAPGWFGMQGQSGIFQSSGTPSYRRVAAGLLDCLASNKARLAAALEVLDIRVDGASAAKALIDQANNLREVDDNTATFAVIEQVFDQFSWRSQIWNSWMRRFSA